MTQFERDALAAATVEFLKKSTQPEAQTTLQENVDIAKGEYFMRPGSQHISKDTRDAAVRRIQAALLELKQS
jgi:hypothetical protein